MGNDDMDRTLAEVEGYDLVGIFEDTANGIPWAIRYYTNPQGKRVKSIPNYSTDLEACMRVAGVLFVKVDFDYTLPAPRIYITSQNDFRLGDTYIEELMCPAATLCPMLVEIAERRKG
jgi:hypothetical protein